MSECDLVFADPDNGLTDDGEKRRRGKRFGKQLPEIRRTLDAWVIMLLAIVEVRNQQIMKLRLLIIPVVK